MAIPSCPKCGYTLFETTVVTPRKSNFKIQMIHCSSCGCVVGTQEYLNIGATLFELAKKLGVPLS